MKILLLNQVFYPDTAATAQHLADLALYLKNLGHEVSVLCSRQAYENPTIKFSTFENYQGIKIYRISTLGLGKKNVFFRVLDSLWFEISLIFRLFFFRKQDWVFCFTSPPLIGFLGGIRTLFTREKLLQWLMDLNIETAQVVGILKNGGWVSKVLDVCFSFSLKRAAQVVVLDRHMKARVAKKHLPPPILVVPPWPLKSVAFDRDPELNPLRKEFGLEGKFVVLYSGNHSLVHPLDTLLQSALHLRDNPSIVFLFIGSGVRVSEVTRFKEKHSLSNIVQLPLQPLEKLKYSLALGDVHVVVLGPKMSGLVHASKIYGVIATGKPFITICEPESHLTDLIKDGYRGFSVTAGDEINLVAIIEKIKSLSPAELTSIRELNQSKLQQDWSRDKILSKLTTFLP